VVLSLIAIVVGGVLESSGFLAGREQLPGFTNIQKGREEINLTRMTLEILKDSI